jgi:ketosteroid isomerase-like protein
MGIPDEEKIARIRRLYEAINGGDFDAVIEMGHPEVVLVRAGGQGELHGPEALREWMQPDAFSSQTLEPLEFEASGDRVLVRVHSTARGAGSGIEIEIDAWTVYTVGDDGRVRRVEIFLEREEDEARRAVGA